MRSAIPFERFSKNKNMEQLKKMQVEHIEMENYLHVFI